MSESAESASAENWHFLFGWISSLIGEMQKSRVSEVRNRPFFFRCREINSIAVRIKNMQYAAVK
jgi:hypothetical protein